MLKFNKEKCSLQTDGIITDIKEVGLETASWRVTVEYKIDDQLFSITEWVKLTFETIKLGPIPIGQKNALQCPI